MNELINKSSIFQSVSRWMNQSTNYQFFNGSIDEWINLWLWPSLSSLCQKHDPSGFLVQSVYKVQGFEPWTPFIHPPRQLIQHLANAHPHTWATWQNIITVHSTPAKPCIYFFLSIEIRLLSEQPAEWKCHKLTHTTTVNPWGGV
jgi:hypothetical protein